MPTRASTDADVAHLVDRRALETLDVLGPTIQFLTPPGPQDDLPCTFRGTIPPGGLVPLHRHADPETFLADSGAVEALVEPDDGARWIRIGPGDVFHVPGDARHAFRNPARAPAEAIERVLAISERYAYWNATPEENAEVGLAVAPPA
jgi:mannose-6-phosphate isomerase-like protein (cupin superfamily)